MNLARAKSPAFSGAECRPSWPMWKTDGWHKGRRSSVATSASGILPTRRPWKSCGSWAMSTRKLQVFDRYRYCPRSVLVPGDRFRVHGGPVYVTDDGKVIPMHERGQFIFRRLCVRGASKWIEADRAGGGGP